MSVNYLISLLLIVFTCTAVFRTINFFRANKFRYIFVFWAYIVLFSLYCLSYALEFAGTTLEIMKFFQAVKVITLSFIPGLIFIVFFDAAGKLKRLNASHLVLIFIIPAVNVILRATSGYHSLYCYNFSIKTYGSMTYLSYSMGIWYYIFSAYLMSFLILSIYLIIKWFLIRKRNKAAVTTLLAMAVLTLVCLMAKTAGSSVALVVLLPFVLPVLSILISANFIGYRLFSNIPLAYKKAFEWSDNSILIVNNELNLIDFNASAEKAIPLLSEAMISKNINDFIDYDGRIRTSILTGSECKLRIIKDYTVHHYRISSSVLLNNAEKKLGYMVSLIDITTLVEAVSELTELASIDTLTRAHTRRYFIQRAAVEFARARRHGHPLSFIILDLDYFKKINDEYGHLAGDEMLKDISKICKTKIRSMDLLGRFGGEEFILLLPETDLEGAVFVAERIRKTIEETNFIYENHSMNMTVSLGVTGAERITDEDFDTFLKYADRALYRAKESGRNRVEQGLCRIEEAST